MNLCSDNHDEICFEGRTCPLCERLKEIEELKSQVSNLKDEIANAE